MSPIYNTMCKKCKKKEEVLTLSIKEEIFDCACGGKRIIMAPSGKSPSFSLKYDPQKDSVDWDGNRSKYYDEYKKAKANGENVRIAQLDGDG